MFGIPSAWRTPLFVVAIAVSTVTAAGYTLAAGDTVPATKAGEAGTAISGIQSATRSTRSPSATRSKSPR